MHPSIPHNDPSPKYQYLFQPLCPPSYRFSLPQYHWQVDSLVNTGMPFCGQYIYIIFKHTLWFEFFTSFSFRLFWSRCNILSTNRSNIPDSSNMTKVSNTNSEMVKTPVEYKSHILKCPCNHNIWEIVY